MPDYKKTLLMPRTEFEMKANLANKEPEIQKNWILEQIEKKALLKNKSNKPFVLHDGPPYANGSIHVGHAQNKILKDIIIRYKTQTGFYTKFIAGWDTHGLPIEAALAKKNKDLKNEENVLTKRRKCYEFAIDNVYAQREQLKRLGLMSDLEEIYLTCDKKFVEDQIAIFYKLIQKKLVFQALKPVYWSWSSQTALADAEIVYQELETDSIYVSVDLDSENETVSKDTKLIIWTTTPWTLPSNLAIAANPKITYCTVLVDKKTKYVVAKSLVEKLQVIFKWTDVEILNEFLGKKLEKLTYISPITRKKGLVIVDNYVLEKDGTGLVHNAPGFGHEDYLACMKYNIGPFCPIDNYGKFNSSCPIKKLIGMFYSEANPIIIEDLKKTNALMHHEVIKHNAACDWRTKKPVIYRATKQWFVNIKDVAKDITKALNGVTSTSPTVIKKIKEMVLNRQEWCISRQRYWGVPICIIYDKDKNPILDKAVLNHTLNIIKQEGIEVWYKEQAKYFLPKEFQNISPRFYKETDIMDVWFDSGCSYTVLEQNKLPFPADMYLEGKDQFRGWFNSSLVTSVIVNNKAPYKKLITHGFVLDGNNNKMSKSLGNVIDPLNVCKEFGADILRLWVASSDYFDDTKISNQILLQISEIYRKIRNTLFRFTLGNLTDFEFEKHKKVEYQPYDLYVLSLLAKDIVEIKKAYDQYDFKKIIQLINYRIVFLSTWYFDFLKDILYCNAKNDPIRISAQKVLYVLLDNYLKILAPIIPHTTEEAYSFFNKKNKAKSIHLEDTFNFKLDLKKYPVETAKWEEFFALKDLVYSELEKARENKIIKRNTEAIVTIKHKKALVFPKTLLAKYLMVAKVEYEKTTSEQFEFVITQTQFNRCERCWNYKQTVKKAEGLCANCTEVLKTL